MNDKEDKERLLRDPHYAVLSYVFDVAKTFFNWTDDEMKQAYIHIYNEWSKDTDGFLELSQSDQLTLVSLTMAKTLSNLMEPSRYLSNRTIKKMVI